jgi:hypothetical protein
MGFDDNDGKVFETMEGITSASSFRIPDNFDELPKEEQERIIKLKRQLESHTALITPWGEIIREREQNQNEAMQQLEEDLINNPNHYHKGGIDIYEIMQVKLTPEEYRGFCKGNIMKYLFRCDLKGNTVQDLEKADFNLKRLIESYKGEKYIPDHKKAEK